MGESVKGTKKMARIKRSLPTWLLWRAGLAVFAVAAAAAGFVAWSRWIASPFRFSSGPRQVDAIRGISQAITYTLAYEGVAPVGVVGALFVVTGESLHVEFDSVWLSTREGAREVRVPADGNLTGEPISLRPGERLYFIVGLRGASRGVNGVRGFRVIFDLFGLRLTQELRLPDDYVIIVG